MVNNMSRISGQLTFDEFKNVCKNVNEDMCIKEIMQRWQNYLMFKETVKDGRASHEVGANVREEDLDE